MSDGLETRPESELADDGLGREEPPALLVADDGLLLVSAFADDGLDLDPPPLPPREEPALRDLLISNTMKKPVLLHEEISSS